MTRHTLPIRFGLIAVITGIVIGVGLALSAEQMDRLTSTDEFCGNRCHSMSAYVTNAASYRQSLHRTTPSGVVAGCADCHISRGLVRATWDHISSGIKDIVAESLHDFEDPAIWQQRRAELAYAVRDKMLVSDSANCRYCHQMNKIAVAGEQGQRAHAQAAAERKTCIQCHANLVHEAVPLRSGFRERTAGERRY